MHRFLLLVGFLVVGAAHAAPAQSLRLEVRVHPERRTPLIRVYNLFDEERWHDALVEKSYPIRLHWRLQLWRSRAGFDGAGRVNEWDVLIRRERLLEQYRFIESVNGRTVMDTAFATLEELRYHYERQQEVRGVAPTRSGEWYYAVRLEVATLSPEDFSRLERGGSAADPTGGFIQRILLSIALPSARLAEQSPVFRVR